MFRLSSTFVPICVVVSLMSCQRASDAQSGSMMSQGMMGSRMGRGMSGKGMMSRSMARHRQVMMYGLPKAYALLHDPLPGTAAVLEKGARIYQQSCAACHGPRGYGNGTAGQQLNPRPANLSSIAGMPMGRSDAYMYWTISDGGQQFGTAMPAFKEALSKDDIWAVIHYLRSGLIENSSRK
jgi:mono/diheme cytochrome c family protein